MTRSDLLRAMQARIEAGDCCCPECCAKNALAALAELAAVVPREHERAVLTRLPWVEPGPPETCVLVHPDDALAWLHNVIAAADLTKDAAVPT